MERCPACDAAVDDAGVAPGGGLRCDKCSTRFVKARAPSPAAGAASGARNKQARDDVDGLGIHPALAKKYRDRASLPPAPSEVQSRMPPPLADEGSEIRDTAPEALPHAPPLKADTRVIVDEDIEPGTTNPGRVVRRSLEGAPPSPSPPHAQAPHPQSPQPSPQAPPPQAASRRQPAPGPPAEPLPVIPAYDVTELVGKGAMGRVYRARHRTTGTQAAIKILAPELAARQDFIQRFEREGAAMRAVTHPGVVAVLDAGSARQPDGSTAHYICMEFVEGPPLRRSLDKGPLPPDLALRYARLMIQGLGAAHERGVIHRDLKPENILVQQIPSSAPPTSPSTPEHPSDRLVLVDFGLAGMLDEHNDPHPNLTKSRMTMGTVNYMAPEQRTDAKRVDQRADLYAAGVILYELLTGDLPLGRFALPTERGVPVPLSVDRCIVRALARNPDERYQIASQFDDDLRAIEAELRRTAGQDTVIGRARGGPSTANRKVALDAADLERLRSAPLPPSVRSRPPSGGARAVLVAPSPVSAISAVPSVATAWLTSAPFIKKSALYWAIGALFLGALAGLVLLRGCAL